MDTFFACAPLPEGQKRRVHFHEFMLEVRVQWCIHVFVCSCIRVFVLFVFACIRVVERPEEARPLPRIHARGESSVVVYSCMVVY